eukprot:scaffold114190_cov46-Prasinocladus_malaysianus.AAC.2
MVGVLCGELEVKAHPGRLHVDSEGVEAPQHQPPAIAVQHASRHLRQPIIINTLCVYAMHALMSRQHHPNRTYLHRSAQKVFQYLVSSRHNTVKKVKGVEVGGYLHALGLDCLLTGSKFNPGAERVADLVTAAYLPPQHRVALC